MINVRHTGSFKNIDKFLKAMKDQDIYNKVEMLAKRGVEALSAATPRNSGATADSWGYDIIKNGRSYSITWVNTNRNKGVNIAIIRTSGRNLQGTRAR